MGARGVGWGEIYIYLLCGRIFSKPLEQHLFFRFWGKIQLKWPILEIFYTLLVYKHILVWNSINTWLKYMYLKHLLQYSTWVYFNTMCLSTNSYKEVSHQCRFIAAVPEGDSPESVSCVLCRFMDPKLSLKAFRRWRQAVCDRCGKATPSTCWKERHSQHFSVWSMHRWGVQQHTLSSVWSGPKQVSNI